MKKLIVGQQSFVGGLTVVVINDFDPAAVPPELIAQLRQSGTDGLDNWTDEELNEYLQLERLDNS